MAKIYLDPGHGGSDSGATHQGRREADDTLKMCLAVGNILQKQKVEVRYSRTTDTDKLLTARTTEANNWGADYYLSIHRNSFDGNASGNETWILSTANNNTQEKAATILNALCKVDGLANRGVKKGAPSYTDFAVNRYTVMPSSLLEMGFITSQKDNTALDQNMPKIATAIAKALCEIIDVPFKEEQSDPDKKNTAADARTALRIAAKIETPDTGTAARLDKDGDGKVTAKDARAILREAAGLETEN